MANTNSGLTENNLKPYQIRHMNVTGVTANNSTITLPPEAHILQIVIKETAGNAITGGLDIGTAATGQQIVAAQAVNGNDYFVIADAAVLLRVFAAAQQIFLTAHTSWNSANINVNIIYMTIPIFGT